MGSDSMHPRHHVFGEGGPDSALLPAAAPTPQTMRFQNVTPHKRVRGAWTRTNSDPVDRCLLGLPKT